MLAASVIVFREIIEAGLIVGILLAVTRGLENARLWIAGGVLAGVVGSCVVAGFTGILASAFAGAGQELFNATILGIAVIMLAWHNIWMARHGRQMAASLKATGSAVSIGAKAPIALFVVVGVAVLREGAEVVLFLYGIAVSDNSSWADPSNGRLFGPARRSALFDPHFPRLAQYTREAPLCCYGRSYSIFGCGHGSPIGRILGTGWRNQHSRHNGVGYVHYIVGQEYPWKIVTYANRIRGSAQHIAGPCLHTCAGDDFCFVQSLCTSSTAPPVPLKS